MKYKKFILSIFILFIYFNVALAETNKLEKVTVTATKKEGTVLTSPISISVIDKETIKTKSVVSVEDLLRDVPGVEITTRSGMGKSKAIYIRGEKRALILVDGQKISEQKSMGTAPPLLIDTNSIERIEVIKGPASTLYGSDAIGGVVNIITKKKADKVVQGSVSGAYNSSTKGSDFSATIYGKKDKLSYDVAASSSRHKDLESAKGKVDNTGSESESVSLGFGYDFSDNFKAEVSYDKFTSDIEVNAEADASQSQKYFFLDLPEWDREKYSISLEGKDISSNLKKVYLGAYSQNTVKDFVNNMDIETMNGANTMEIRLNTLNDQDTQGITAQTDWLFNRHYLIFGVDYLKDELDSKESNKITNSHPAMMSKNSDNNYFYKGENKTLAFFVQDDISLSEKFTLIAGLRFSDYDSELSSTNNPKSFEKDNSDNNTAGSLNLVFAKSQNTTFRIGYAQGYRTPTLIESYIGTSHGSGNFCYSNSDLKAETSDNYEIGARFSSNNLSLDSALFYSASEDYITTGTVDGKKQFINMDESTSKGVELSLNYLIEKLNLTPYLSATYIDREYKQEGFETDKTGLPDYSGRFGVEYTKEFASLIFKSDFFLRFASEAEEQTEKGGEITKYKSWTTANLNLGLSFGKDSNYSLNAELGNLFDKEYKVAKADFDEAGRYGIVKLTVNF